LIVFKSNDFNFNLPYASENIYFADRIGFKLLLIARRLDDLTVRDWQCRLDLANPFKIDSTLLRSSYVLEVAKTIEDILGETE
jgi:hypothetical protein